MIVYGGMYMHVGQGYSMRFRIQPVFSHACIRAEIFHAMDSAETRREGMRHTTIPRIVLIVVELV